VQARGGTAIADLGLKADPLPEFEAAQLGDCIDCTICVQVCPTGIDIRNGLQYECIACGACIDACDEVMDKMGYPHGLIRYSTQNAIDDKPTRVLRPRVFVYGVLLLALCTGWAWGVTHRSSLIVDVLRDRNALYREVGDGRIENSYTLKIVNKDDKAQRYRITLVASTNVTMPDSARRIGASAEEVLVVPLTLSAPATVHGKQQIVFEVMALDGSAHQSVASSFFGPAP
jgi:cytochrome c oxidase accessory protein FixG